MMGTRAAKRPARTYSGTPSGLPEGVEIGTKSQEQVSSNPVVICLGLGHLETTLKIRTDMAF